MGTIGPYPSSIYPPPEKPEIFDWKKDRLLIGAYWPNRKPDDTPYDHFEDPVSGKREGQTQPKTWGTNYTDLRYGFKNWMIFPPLEIWTRGVWASDMELVDMPTSIAAKSEDELFQIYLVSGEGTPGNYEFRSYRCPPQICGVQNPKHPLMWPKKLREDGDGVTSPPTSAYATSVPYKPPNSVVVPKAPAAPPLPAGIRFRCTMSGGCGHWFKETQLKAHAEVCPVKNGGFSDWAIMCDDECGCKTLDEACTPKPGFPRETIKKEEVNTMSAGEWVKGIYDEVAKIFVPDHMKQGAEEGVDAWRHTDGTMVFEEPKSQGAAVEETEGDMSPVVEDAPGEAEATSEENKPAEVTEQEAPAEEQNKEVIDGG